MLLRDQKTEDKERERKKESCMWGYQIEWQVGGWRNKVVEKLKEENRVQMNVCNINYNK